MNRNRDSALRPYLELIRLPAVFTAPADVLMGAALIGSMGIPFAIPDLVCLVAASILVYCAGMATNDLFDQRVDAVERPERPLPSGRLSRLNAWILVGSCQVGALILASYVGQISAFAIGATIISTYLYNSSMKATPIGPLIMGGCRFCNGCIGLSVAGMAAANHELVLLVPGLVALYVAVLTWIARYETHGDDTGTVYVLLVVQVLIALGPVSTMLIGDLTVASWHVAFGLLGPLWLLPNLFKFRGTIGAGQIRGAVMRGIMGIAVVNAAFAASVGQYAIALIIVGLLVPGRFVGRWFYAT